MHRRVGQRTPLALIRHHTENRGGSIACDVEQTNEILNQPVY